MHLEIQVALNFVMSYLYNKLPRRRVNIFGEELEKALKAKFEGHWYPEKPCRGSAFRCLKTSNPVDPVLCIAARESGMDLQDIREHLPQDMSVWIDPGEVSYRIGEKGQIKLLMSEKRGGGVGVGVGVGGGVVSPTQAAAAMAAAAAIGGAVPNGGGVVGVGGPNGGASVDDLALELERDALAKSVFNPEAQAFKPSGGVDGLAASMSSLRVGSPTTHVVAPSVVVPSPPKQTVTFTTAAFAQTKFGSTKLKNSSKRPNRMSPTEFSHYIKQRALLQQQQRQKFGAPLGNGGMAPPTSPPRGFPMGGMQQGQGQGQQGHIGGFPRPRSLSPIPFGDLVSGAPMNGYGPNSANGALSYLSDFKSAPVPAGISPFPDTTGLWQPPSASDLSGGLSGGSFGGGSGSSASSNGSVTPPPLITLPPLQPAPNSFGSGGQLSPGAGVFGGGAAWSNGGSTSPSGFGFGNMGAGNGGGSDLNGAAYDFGADAATAAGFNLGALASYAGNNANNYQHLLVAN